ncbi:MAG TPA: cupin domain-containing protein [Rhizomicrobium sp.]|nr:cupin domain-containing protein [Rhizomicrobium sp.]
MTKADRIIRILKLKPHPEGGYFRETFRDPKGKRAHSTAIYFLLKKGQASRWHRVDAAEVWHWYGGAPLELLIGKSRAKPKRHVLGGNLAKGERPQIVVPAGHWQAARSTGVYTLAGCTVAPGFLFSKFALAELPSAWRRSRPARGKSPAKTHGPHSRDPD